MFSCLSASPEWKRVEMRAEIENEHPSDFDRLAINELFLKALKMPAQLAVKFLLYDMEECKLELALEAFLLNRIIQSNATIQHGFLMH